MGMRPPGLHGFIQKNRKQMAPGGNLAQACENVVK